MYKRLRGEWHQAFMEPCLDLHFKGDGLGHFHTVCVAEDMPGMGNKLTFDIDFDQTEVPDLLASMDGIVSNFPVRGAPRRTNK